MASKATWYYKLMYLTSCPNYIARETQKMKENANYILVYFSHK